VRLTATRPKQPSPGTTFRLDCRCGVFTICHVTAALPHACSGCGLPLPDGIAARLQAARRFHGLSIPELAATAGVARTTLRAWEAGTSPIPPAKQAVLAAALDISPDLLGARADPRSSTERQAPAAERSPARHTRGTSRQLSTTPTPGDASPASDHTAPLRVPAPPRTTRIVVELACLLCSRELGTLEAHVWPTPAPVRLNRPGLPAVTIPDWRVLRCGTCGGAAVTGEVTRHVVRKEAPFDWNTDRPRRGRPPKAVVPGRASNSSAA
jgi:transcriptional regulator with XRE-family HTH domain